MQITCDYSIITNVYYNAICIYTYILRKWVYDVCSTVKSYYNDHKSINLVFRSQTQVILFNL